jgi:hypothetical protein
MARECLLVGVEGPGEGFRKQLSILESLLAANGIGRDELADLLHAHTDPSLTMPEILCPG